MKIEILPLSILPSDLAVSAARTCYSSKGLILPHESSNWSKKDELLKSVFDAGHHTTLQHTHITLTIEGISRQLIWRLFHSHPFYNSEQVSQRYAKMQKDSFIYPYEANKEIWGKYYERIFNTYEVLTTLLTPIMQKTLPKFRKKDAVKKAQEMARYVLPQGMSAYMYHTINIITALRYIMAAKVLPEAQSEAREFARQLSQKLIELDISLKPLIDFANSSDVEFLSNGFGEIKQRYDVKKSEFVKVLDAMPLLHAGPIYNYAEILRPFTIFPDASVAGGFSSYIKLSLSADAQNQRHRASLATRPSLKSIYRPDFYEPPIIAENSEISKIYQDAMALSYSFFEEEVLNVGFGEAVYALPNSHLIEIVEFNDYARFVHKSQMRLCYNAQQEIFDIVYEQIKQLKEQNIDTSLFVPPCTIRDRSNIQPICPEGVRYCGEKVWKKDFSELIRLI
ncbi:MAG: hypothetical protein RL154_762 [Pseudomonadota bacterium]|jgi:flavin-dependent thymidylate synthase